MLDCFFKKGKGQFFPQKSHPMQILDPRRVTHIQLFYTKQTFVSNLQRSNFMEAMSKIKTFTCAWTWGQSVTIMYIKFSTSNPHEPNLSLSLHLGERVLGQIRTITAPFNYWYNNSIWLVFISRFSSSIF